jgi:hypothetical protein
LDEESKEIGTPINLLECPDCWKQRGLSRDRVEYLLLYYILTQAKRKGGEEK